MASSGGQQRDFEIATGRSERAWGVVDRSLQVCTPAKTARALFRRFRSSFSRAAMASAEVEATPEAAAPAPEDTAAPSAAAALAPEDNAAEPAAAAPAPEAAPAPAAGSPRGYRAGLERSVYHLGELPVRRVPLTATGAPTAASPPAVEQRGGSGLLGAPQLSRPASRGSHWWLWAGVRSRCSAPNQRPRHAGQPRPKLRILRHLNQHPGQAQEEEAQAEAEAAVTGGASRQPQGQPGLARPAQRPRTGHVP